MSQAMQFSQVGPSSVLQLREVDVPAPGVGEIHIRVAAAGVNPVDWKIRSGLRPIPADVEWHGTGDDGAGWVVATGAGVEGFRAGDPVVFCNAGGSYATDVVLDAHHVFPRPANVSAAQGAAIGIPVGTAYQVMRSLAVSAHDTVLIHGGSGSVGQALIQFVVGLGASVVATSSPERADTVAALGATHISYGDGLLERAKDAAPDGYTVAIDCAGTDEALDVSLALVSDRSRIGTIVRGADADAYGIQAWRGGSTRQMTAQQNAWRLEAVPVALALMAAGSFTVELGETYPLANAAKAQDDSQSGAPGKLIVLP